MAKKNTTVTKKVEKKEEVENKIMNDINTVVSEEISDIIEKMEDIKPTEDFINSVMDDNGIIQQEMVEKEIEKINTLQEEVENKINEVIKSNPSLVKKIKNSNFQFTNIWNGMVTE
jgi:hypothetical protein